MSSAPRDPHGLRALGAEVSAALDGLTPDPARLERQRASLLQAASRRPPRRLAPVALGGLSLAAAALLAAGFLSRTRASPGALTALASGAPVTEGAWLSAGRDRPLSVRFSDGSAVTLAPHGAARVVSLGPRGAVISLESGRAEVSVRPARGARWAFSAGPYSVQVTGTAFTLGWSPSSGAFDLGMRSGRVVLRGPRCEEGLVVRQREEVHGRLHDGTLTLGPALPAPPRTPTASPTEPLGAPAGPTPQVPIPLLSQGVTNEVRSPRGRRPAPPARAARGAPERAPSGVLPGPALEGGRAAWDPETASASALLSSADEARYQGQAMRARDLLLVVRRRFPAAREARRAAFTLGVLALDVLRAPSQSARWFELYLQEDPGGALAGEARGRLIRAHDEAGDREAARRAASRYLESDPGGAFEPYARAVLRP